MPGQARNFGANKAMGKFLAFIDADCVAEPNWMGTLLAALENGHTAVGGAVLQGDRWNPVSQIDNLMQFVDLHPARPEGPASLLPSCNLAISKQAFDAIGGFPELKLPAGEDVLFCANVRSQWKESLYFEPAMRVRHFGRAGLRDFWRHQVLFGYCRGVYALELRPAYRLIGRNWIFAPAVALKRLSYLLSHAAGHPASFVRMIVLLPLLFVGVTAWCIGFRRGCMEHNPVESIT
jgi:GT2 family glycosyltransferase